MIHVLIVDDDTLICEQHAKLLRDLGCDVAKAFSGDEALEYLKKSDNAVDIIFSDLSMPGQDGYQLADEVHKINDNVVFCLVTNFYDTEFINSIEQENVNELCSKPLTREQVLNVFDRFSLKPSFEITKNKP